MAILYDNYVYRLTSTNRIALATAAGVTPLPTAEYTIDLPKDLQWADELTWGKVAQALEYSVTGALLIQEGTKLSGRYVSLVGQADMAWLTRAQGTTLLAMKNTAGLVMTLNYLDSLDAGHVLFSMTVMFRHTDGAVSLSNIKSWDQYESTAWYIAQAINLIEVGA